MQKRYSHLEEYKWSCNLYVPDNPDRSMTGNVEYTPGKGVTFEILISDFNLIENLKSIEVLHGISIEFGRFSLLKCLYLSSEGTGNLSKLRFHARLVIFGDFFDLNTSFDSLRFGLIGLDQFCEEFNRVNTKNSFEHSFLSGDYSDAKLSIKKTNYSGPSVGKKNVLDEFYFRPSSEKISNEELGKKLSMLNEDIFNALQGDDGYINVIKKEDPVYEVFLDSLKDCSYEKLFRHVNGLNNLFSILLLRPSYFTHLNVYKKNSSNKTASFPILMSSHFDEKGIEKSKNNKKPFLKISSRDICGCFQVVLDSWQELSTSLDLTLNVISQHIKGYDYNVVQHSVVCISALEQWYSRFEGSEPKNHYDFMIGKYATEEMKKKLEEFIPLKIKVDDAGKLSYGASLTSIRGVILHPKKVRGVTFKDDRKVKELTEFDLYNLTEVIIMILIRALYTKFGISESHLNTYFGSEGAEVLCEHTKV